MFRSRELLMISFLTLVKFLDFFFLIGNLVFVWVALIFYPLDMAFFFSHEVLYLLIKYADFLDVFTMQSAHLWEDLHRHGLAFFFLSLTLLPCEPLQLLNFGITLSQLGSEI